MAADFSFVDFVRRIRAGDDDAAETLVRRYEPVIRREVRSRIEDARLRLTWHKKTAVFDPGLADRTPQ